MLIIHKFHQFLLISLIAFAPASFATFHIWDINEIYSNIDGSVQFIEIASTSSAQERLSGHTLVASNSNGTQSNTFVFPDNVVGDTKNQKILIATPGFAQLKGAIQPDFVIPPGFLFTSGTLNFGENASVLSYDNLPKDGIASYDASLESQTNSPTNFKGQSGSLDGTIFAIYDASTQILRGSVANIPGNGNFSIVLKLDQNSGFFEAIDIQPVTEPSLLSGNNISGLITFDFLTLIATIPFGFIVDNPLLFSVDLQLQPIASDNRIFFSIIGIKEILAP